ncbi:MAG: hypothetical protein HY891_00755 [Deltaproteobacteria bacterium]|nr:hypothetical protein [Deltaproteobacteria bacterium]
MCGFFVLFSENLLFLSPWRVNEKRLPHHDMDIGCIADGYPKDRDPKRCKTIEMMVTREQAHHAMIFTLAGFILMRLDGSAWLVVAIIAAVVTALSVMAAAGATFAIAPLVQVLLPHRFYGPDYDGLLILLHVGFGLRGCFKTRAIRRVLAVLSVIPARKYQGKQGFEKRFGLSGKMLDSFVRIWYFTTYSKKSRPL